MPENVNTSVLTIDDSSKTEEVDNRETMIKIDHVSMVFNMASEQLNSLKEYAIKLAKRELFFEGFKALDDISFEVKKGDVFGIMGTNGSGKSTLLKIVAGVLEPSEGTCEINGSIAPLIELGAGFDMDLTARENIYLNGALLGYSKKFIDENFDEIVSFAEVEKFLDMPLKNYSSGMVARIAFAIATVIIPEILIVDEVLSVGDFMFQKKCEDRINQLIEEHGVTVLIVSHSNEQIARLCNKAIWIEKGHTRLMGNAEEVCRVYGALGGRTGSPEAERRVFHLLQNKTERKRKAPYKTIEGDSASGMGARFVRASWKGETFTSLALACDNTHVNSIVANALASAEGAPILPVKLEEVPDSVETILYDVQPRKIFLFDCGGHAKQVRKKLSSLPWKPEIVHFGEGKELFAFSLEVLSYGKEKGYWDKECALIGFVDNPESLVVSAYLYQKKCPVVMYLPGELTSESFNDTFKEGPFSCLSVFGKDAALFVKNMAVNLDGLDVLFVGIGKKENSCLEITRFVFDYLKGNSVRKTPLCVASMASSQWADLISYGSFGGKTSTALLIGDSTNLDSVAESLDFVREEREQISELIFTGGKMGMGEGERDLFLNEFLS